MLFGYNEVRSEESMRRNTDYRNLELTNKRAKDSVVESRPPAKRVLEIVTYSGCDRSPAGHTT